MSTPEQQATVIDPARQIRVRTSTGWANLVIQGPPGYPDVTGHAGQVLTVPTPAGPPIWSFVAGLPAGGALGTVLTKKSAADFDTVWSVVQGLPADTVVAAGTRIIANKLAAADTQNAWVVNGNGLMTWGAGGSSSPDTTLQRLTGGGTFILNAPNGLSTGGALGVFGYNAVNAGTYQGPGGTFGSVRAAASGFAFSAAVLGDTGTVRWNVDPTGKLSWADGTITNPDVNLYRWQANYLRTDNYLTTRGTQAAAAATTDWSFWSTVGGESQPRLIVLGDGRHQWGPGGATPADTYLYRNGANSLKTDGGFWVGGNAVAYGGVYSQYGNTSAASGFIFNPGAAVGNSLIVQVQGEANPRFVIDVNGKHNWGAGAASALDTNLYRSSAGQVGTDGTWVSLAPSSGATGFWRYSAAANGWFGVSQVQGEANMRWGADVAGTMKWGPGGATATDTTLYRYFANALKTDGGLYVGTGVNAAGTGGNTGFQYQPATAGGYAFVSQIGSDANARYACRYDGYMQWGAGGATAMDCIMQRNGAKQLMVGGGSAPTSLTIFADNTVWPFVMYDAAAATQPYFRIENTGTMRWGDKTNPADTTLYRGGVNVLRTDQHFWAGLDVYAQYGLAQQVRVGNANGNATINFGSPMDTNIYRAAANTLKTDGAMQAVIGFNALNMGGAGYSAYQASVSGDTTPRYIVAASGSTSWGPGNAANDTNLYRRSAGSLGTDGQFTVGNTCWNLAGGYWGFLYYPPSATPQMAFGSNVQGEANQRFSIWYDGTMYWGPGGATATDTKLYRNGANALKTDGQFAAGLQITSAVSAAGTAALYANNLAASGFVIAAKQGTDTSAWRFLIDANGQISWGPGGAVNTDTLLYRNAALQLRTNGSLIVDGLVTPASLGAGARDGTRFLRDDGTWQLAPAAAGALPSDIAIAAGTRIIKNLLVGTDAQPGFQLNGDGRHLWGPGGSTVPDTNLYRANVGQLRTDGTMAAAVFSANQASVTNAMVTYVTNDTSNRFTLKNDGTMSWGPGNAGGDVSLYRRTTAQIMCDGLFIAGNASYSGFTTAGGNGFIFNPTTAGGYSLISAVQGESQWRFYIDVSGTMRWGPGGSSGQDTTLSRIGAGSLQVTTNMVSTGYYSANNGSANQILLWQDGTIRLRGTAADVLIRGVAAGQLATDQCFSVGPGTRGGNQANEYTIAIYKSNISVVPNVGGAFGVLYVGSDNRLYYVDPTGTQRAIG